jgi:hypothetical protein
MNQPLHLKPTQHPRGHSRPALPAAWLFALAVSLLASGGAWAQTNQSDTPRLSDRAASTGAGPSAPVMPDAVRAEQMRAVCVQDRRCVCGRILKVLPEGLVVESGYPSLLRTNLHGAWLIPGTVTAARDPNLVESRRPDSICAGLVFLTDLPKLRRARLRPHDYVVLHAYPAGRYTYVSAGNVRRIVRRFAGGLETAVRLSLQSGGDPTAGTAAK